MIIAVM